ncbi:unnamed protein product [Schistosoma curassoni]|uniref:Peptidylprolyl isomerase n=1 Tax=Schistosoma curassoni TaxID=6186 RepID=A0A183KQE3_9TREM|nr:unnamed protein product [Schistosoma curassoni]
MGGKVIPPEEGGCPRCGKRVYDAEKAIGCPSGVSLFKYFSSNNSVVDATYEVVSCYGKNFGPKGFGFGQGAGALNMG